MWQAVYPTGLIGQLTILKYFCSRKVLYQSNIEPDFDSYIYISMEKESQYRTNAYVQYCPATGPQLLFCGGGAYGAGAA